MDARGERGHRRILEEAGCRGSRLKVSFVVFQRYAAQVFSLPIEKINLPGVFNTEKFNIHSSFQKNACHPKMCAVKITYKIDTITLFMFYS
jgi:hypothetical protein